MTRSLSQLRQEIYASQEKDCRILTGAIVGRAVTVEQSVNDINRVLKLDGDTTARYVRAGQIALVYLFRNELSQHRGKTFFNTSHVASAIDKAPPSVKKPITIHRGGLEVVHKPYGMTADRQTPCFWLMSSVASAVFNSDGQDDTKSSRANLHTEELALANNLFTEDNSVTGSPYLWLGAIAAPNVATAEAALDTLENIIKPQLIAEPVSLIPYKR